MRRITVMSSRGQIVVPIEIRHQLKWNAGTQLMVEWSSQSRRLVLSPVKKRDKVGEFKTPPAGILRDVYPVSTTDIAQLCKGKPIGILYRDDTFVRHVRVHLPSSRGGRSLYRLSATSCLKRVDGNSLCTHPYGVIRGGETVPRRRGHRRFFGPTVSSC